MIFHSLSCGLQRGSVFFSLFAAVGMIGVLGAMTIALLKGPVKTMSEVTRRTVAENNMIAAGKLAIIVSDSLSGDCDGDGAVEPLEWADAGASQKPVNGGLLPSTVGATMQDPWGNTYGFCSWDHGTVRMDSVCGASAKRLKGSLTRDNIVISVISSGPDRTFQTTCNEEGAGNYVDKISGSDDLIMSYTYAEAVIASGGLWRLEEEDAKTAEIQKNLSVKDETGVEQFSFDAASKQLALGTGGTGAMPKVKTDFLQPLDNASVELLSNLKMQGIWLSGDGTAKGLQITSGSDLNVVGKLALNNASNNAIGIEASASGTSATGLKITGTAKAIESNGIVDMMNNKIVNLATPTADTDAATKKYVDDAVAGTVGQVIKCESFVFTNCTGSVTHASLTKTNLGACKKACEAAGVQCCEAELAALPGNPNTTLANCKGYDAPSITGAATRNNALAALLGGSKFIAALCYLQ